MDSRRRQGYLTEIEERRSSDGQPARHRQLDLQRRVRAAFDRRRPRARRSPALHARRDRGARRPAAARLGAARARQPAAGQPRRLRRHRRGAAVGDDPRHRAQRLPVSLRDIQQDAEYSRPDRRVPRRGRGDPRDARGRHAAPHRLPVHHRAGLEHADALRPRAQLPAPGAGGEARQRRGVRGRLDPPARARPLLRRGGVRLRRHGGDRGGLPHRPGRRASTCRRSCRTG